MRIVLGEIKGVDCGVTFEVGGDERVFLKGVQIPNLKAHLYKRPTGEYYYPPRYGLVLSNRCCYDPVSENDFQAAVWFIAQAMAVVSGYKSFAEMAGVEEEPDDDGDACDPNSRCLQYPKCTCGPNEGCTTLCDRNAKAKDKTDCDCDLCRNQHRVVNNFYLDVKSSPSGSVAHDFETMRSMAQ